MTFYKRHAPNHREHIPALEFAFFHLLQKIQSLDIKLAQQRRLPRIPDIGTHCFDVGEREQVKHFQIIHAAHRTGKIEDRFLLFQVAAKRRVGHQQMVPDQKLD